MADTLHRNRINGTPSVASLVGGIISDAQDLLRQEIALARQEVREELSKTKAVAISFGIGTCIAAAGSVLLCFMLVHLLHWFGNGQIALWGCYGIVGSLLALGGAALILQARNTAQQIDFVPRQTVETMKENVQWITNPR